MMCDYLPAWMQQQHDADLLIVHSSIQHDLKVLIHCPTGAADEQCRPVTPELRLSTFQMSEDIVTGMGYIIVQLLLIFAFALYYYINMLLIVWVWIDMTDTIHLGGAIQVCCKASEQVVPFLHTGSVEPVWGRVAQNCGSNSPLDSEKLLHGYGDTQVASSQLPEESLIPSSCVDLQHANTPSLSSAC